MITHGLLLVALTIAAEPTPAQLLVGTWVSTKGQGNNQTTASVTFDTTGRMNNRIVSPTKIRMRIGFYQLDGNKLTATLEENRNITTDTVTIKELNQNTLIIDDGSGASVFKRRN